MVRSLKWLPAPDPAAVVTTELAADADAAVANQAAMALLLERMASMEALLAGVQQGASCSTAHPRSPVSAQDGQPVSASALSRRRRALGPSAPSHLILTLYQRQLPTTQLSPIIMAPMADQEPESLSQRTLPVCRPRPCTACARWAQRSYQC